MMRNKPIRLSGRRCRCGAVADEGSRSCRKCLRRALAPPQRTTAPAAMKPKHRLQKG
jgi:hypothetical protein